MAANLRSRCWQFTVNNYQNLPVEVVNDTKRRLSAAKYWVIGLEKCPSTGTSHWQGFLWTHNAVRFNTVRGILEGTNAHITRCDDKAFEMMMYCKKDGEFEEYGTPPESQKRKGEAGAEASKAKWRKIDTLAREGKFDELREEFPGEWVRCHRTLKAIRQETFNSEVTLDGELRNEYLWGEAGAGKSRRARRENPGAYVKDIDYDSEKWWDLYAGEECVIIDDLAPSHWKIAHALKRWADRYSFKAQTKCGYMNIRPLKIVITSQYQMDDIWRDKETLDALRRRFKEIHVTREEEEDKWISPAQEVEIEPVVLDSDCEEEL